MPDTVENVYIRQYTQAVMDAANQRESKARRWCETRTQTGGPGFGNAVAFDKVGYLDFQDKIGRGQPTPRQDPQHDRVWAFPAASNIGIPIEDVDVTKMLIDPTGKYQTIVREAMGRKYDDVIFAAALGTAVTGVDGAGTETWPVTDRLGRSHVILTNGAGSTTGLNLEKFLMAKRILGDLDVDENLVFFVSPQAVELALALTQFGSVDYNTYKALAEGRLTTYGGVEWVTSSRLTKATTTRSCILMQRGAVGFVGSLEKVRVGENPALSYENQVYGEIACGAVRRSGERIVEVQITEAA